MNQLNLNNSMVSSANGHYLIVFILLEKFLTFTRPPKSHQTICTRSILTSVQSFFTQPKTNLIQPEIEQIFRKTPGIRQFNNHGTKIASWNLFTW